MFTETTILVAFALIFGLYMAWNIGANDVANAMGTSVGSGALTLKRAVILAAIMEFAGAFLVGPHVTETVRAGIIDLTVFTSDPEGWRMLCYGMLASMLAAGAWLQLASYFGWPVSTTHSIVGAIVGFGAVYGGVEAVNWLGDGTFIAVLRGDGGVASIVASWVVSPLLSGVIAYLIFRFTLRQIFYQPDPVAAARKLTPYIVAVVFGVMMLVLWFKGLKPFLADNFKIKPTSTEPIWAGWISPVHIGLAGSLVVSVVGALVARVFVRRIKPSDPSHIAAMSDLYVTRALSKSLMHLRRVRNTSKGESAAEATAVLKQAEALYDKVRERSKNAGEHNAFRDVERIFVVLQIISACFVAFAHGANDVANAIGPLAAVVSTAQAHEILVDPSVDTWVLLVGGIGIVVGLATWGWRVIATVGSRITELTPSRGFCAEFAAALTILIASVYKLPVSTTHTLVGAVLGVGLARGIGAINLNTIRDIVASWLITIPAGAGLSILFFYALRLMFG